MNRICLINLFIDLSLTSTSTSQMLPFLLLVAAALPVLGEAQIKKQQNAGKKRGNKIRDQNPLPSCTNHSTSSTSYERSPLFLEIPQNAQLFGHPGTRHRFKKKMKWEFCSWILSKDPSAGDKPGISGKLVNPLPPRILPCPSSWLSWNSRWARYWDSTGRGKTDIKKS